MRSPSEKLSLTHTLMHWSTTNTGITTAQTHPTSVREAFNESLLFVLRLDGHRGVWDQTQPLLGNQLARHPADTVGFVFDS